MTVAAVLALSGMGAASRARAEGPAPEEGKPIVIGRELTLPSRILDRRMALRVYLPDGYGRAGKRYPVLYTFQSFFHHVSGIASYLSRVNAAPELIVVSVVNYASADLSPEKLESNPDSGGADRFIRFFREELHPFIDARFRTHPYRLLYSGSFGGAFVVYALLSQPDLFHAYIAATPAITYEGGSDFILENAESLFKRAVFRNRYLFMAVENEPALMPALEKFVALLRRQNPGGLAWEFHPWPEEDHYTLPHRTIFQGLRGAFARWSRLPEEVAAGGADAIRTYHQEVSAWYGGDLGLSRSALYRAARDHMERENYEEAVQVGLLLTEIHPDYDFGYRLLGQAYEAAGRLDAALSACETAYDTAVKNDSPHLGVFKGALESLREKIRRGKGSSPP